MSDVVLGKLKFDDINVESTLTKIISQLNAAEQAALKAAIAQKEATQKVMETTLENTKKQNEALLKTLGEQQKAQQSVQKTAVETQKVNQNTNTSFGTLARTAGSSFKAIVSGLGLVGGSMFIVRGLVDSVKEKFQELAKTEDGREKLKAIQTEVAKTKAVYDEFIEQGVLKSIPFLNKVGPIITEFAIQMTGVFVGLGVFVKESFNSLLATSKFTINKLKIAGNELLAFFGNENANKRITELQAKEKELLKDMKSFSEIEKLSNKAIADQIGLSRKAAAEAKINNAEKKKGKIETSEYLKLIEKFQDKTDKAELELLSIQDPVAKINRAKELAIAEIDKLDKVIRQAATEEKRKLPINYEADLALLKKSILTEFDEELKKAEDELFQKAEKQRRITIPIALNTRVLTEQEDEKTDVSKFTDPLGKLLGVGTQKDANGNYVVPDRTISGKVKTDFKIEPGGKEKFSFERFISKLFPNPEDIKIFEEKFKEIYSNINFIISEGINRKLDNNAKALDGIREGISIAQEGIKEEERLQNEGSANNLATKKRNLEELKKEEAKALQERAGLQRKLAQQQLIADSLQQASSLATAVSKIFAANAGIPIAGIVTALASISTMFALFARFKSQARAAATEVRAYRGGALDKDYGFVNTQGRTDKFGGRGHKVEDSNLILGGKEFVNKEEVSVEHRKFLYELNTGKFDGLDLNQIVKIGLASRQMAEVAKDSSLDILPERIESFKVDYRILEKNRARQVSGFVTKKEMKKMFDKLSREIRENNDEKPQYIPITKETTGYLLKSKKVNAKIELE